MNKCQNCEKETKKTVTFCSKKCLDSWNKKQVMIKKTFKQFNLMGEINL